MCLDSWAGVRWQPIGRQAPCGTQAASGPVEPCLVVLPAWPWQEEMGGRDASGSARRIRGRLAAPCEGDEALRAEISPLGKTKLSTHMEDEKAPERAIQFRFTPLLGSKELMPQDGLDGVDGKGMVYGAREGSAWDANPPGRCLVVPIGFVAAFAGSIMLRRGRRQQLSSPPSSINAR